MINRSGWIRRRGTKKFESQQKKKKKNKIISLPAVSMSMGHAFLQAQLLPIDAAIDKKLRQIHKSSVLLPE